MYPTSLKTLHRIIHGDARIMRELEKQSVQMIVTSPPYWQLKDYGGSNQIGYHHSYEEYINHLNLVWNECYRILEDGCRLCVNIGDQYARSVYYGRYKVIPIRTEIIKFCETIGFDYMGAIIWQKVATTNTTGGAMIMGSFPYPRNGILKLDYEFILIFKKVGTSKRKVNPEIKERSKLSKEEWNTYFAGHWNFSGVRQDKHLAMFPPELPKRLIKMFTFIGDTVLDPFLGSGTTSIVARQLQRHSVGYEIQPECLPVITERFKEDEQTLFESSDVVFEKQTDDTPDFQQMIERLPYIFKDPVRLAKKIDPKTLQFGSKIDQNSPEREQYYSVKEIVSPSVLVLNTGVTVRLIGIQEDEQKREQALQFLHNMLKGQKVFMKFDDKKQAEEHDVWCYLYLKNKTFVNAALLKHHLAKVDDTIDFKYKSRFQQI
jgi:modification methylase